jgi:hypothetical protein
MLLIVPAALAAVTVLLGPLRARDTIKVYTRSRSCAPSIELYGG